MRRGKPHARRRRARALNRKFRQLTPAEKGEKVAREVSISSTLPASCACNPKATEGQRRSSASAEVKRTDEWQPQTSVHFTLTGGASSGFPPSPEHICRCDPDLVLLRRQEPGRANGKGPNPMAPGNLRELYPPDDASHSYRHPRHPPRSPGSRSAQAPVFSRHSSASWNLTCSWAAPEVRSGIPAFAG